MGDKAIQYTAVDLPALRALRAETASEAGMTAGTYSSRTYVKQGGRGQ